MARRARALSSSSASMPWGGGLMTRAEVLGPTLVVAVVFALFVGVRLGDYGGDPTGFIQFGRMFAPITQPPAGAPMSRAGYDGQFFWAQAQDPLLLRADTVRRLRTEAYRTQRMAYPALADITAAGRAEAIPWTMLGLNLLVVVAITVVVARFEREQGRSGWWALVVGLTPGLVLATMRDLSDPLATACMLAGLLAWRRDRRWPAAALMTVAVLAREPMTLGVAAVAVDAAVGWWRGRSEPGALARTVRRVWPVVVIPAVAFVAWAAYIDLRFQTNVLATYHGLAAPFVHVIQEARRTQRKDPPDAAIWEFCYLVLALGGLGTAAWMTARQPSAASVAALLFGLIFTMLPLDDQWGASRFGAPLFVTLLVAGSERDNPLARRICVLTVALTALIPNALAGG